MFRFRPRGTTDIISAAQKTTNLFFISLRAPFCCRPHLCLGSSELRAELQGHGSGRPGPVSQRCSAPPPPGDDGGRVPPLLGPRTPRAAGAGTVCPAGRWPSPAVTHSVTPFCARQAEPPPRAAPPAPGEGAEARGQVSTRASGRPLRPQTTERKRLQLSHLRSEWTRSRRPALKPGSLSRTGTHSRPAPHRPSLPGAPRPTDLERCFRICFLIIPAMVSACPRPSRRPAGSRNAPHPCARPCPRWGERRERSRYPHSRSLGARRHLGRSIAR